MSKRDLKLYLNNLNKEQLIEQLLDLYSRFKNVKTYYDFAFNPNERKLLDEAKFKITKEYFPLNGRKPKRRRSVAQKIIKHFIQLGVDSYIIADVMCYNIETAQQFSLENNIQQEAFYKSMLKSYREAVEYIEENGIMPDFKTRLNTIISQSIDQDWLNSAGFENAFTYA
ncbi:MAG: hypothetical protein GXO79_02440 [Chlorobi bacterium]|nr:hypothetical protein [Chlorobiota bacterium]